MKWYFKIIILLKMMAKQILEQLEDSEYFTKSYKMSVC